MNLLIQGVYDNSTLRTLTELGINHFGFDLRARSPNLIPFNHLKNILKDVSSEKIHLIFENDKETTILSFLNLLKDQPFKFILEFRDQMPASFYDGLNRPFVWMFHPESDWKEILHCRELNGIILPLKWKENYQNESEIWDIIDRRKLDVYLHASTFEEAQPYISQEQLNISIDLSLEVEKGFRAIDQERLKKLKFWSLLYENTSRQ